MNRKRNNEPGASGESRSFKRTSINRLTFIVLLSVTLLTFTGVKGYGQIKGVGISEDTQIDPDASALLELRSTERGLLVPRMTTAQRTGISNPANGLLVYDTDQKSFLYYDAPDHTWKAFSALDRGTANQILGMNADGDSIEYKTLIGTTNQINIDFTTGQIQISTPQDIDTEATPEFTNINIDNLGDNQGVYTDNSGLLTSTPPSSGVIGYWTRNELLSLLAPAHTGDSITTSGSIYTSGNGNIYTSGTGNIYTANGDISTLGNGNISSANTITAGTSITAGSSITSGTSVTVGNHLTVTDGGADITGTTSIDGATTISNGIVNINNNSNYATNINTNTSTGDVTIGGVDNKLYLPKFTTAGILHNTTDGEVTSGLLTNADIDNATINLTEKVTGILPIANGGTNSATALNGSSIIVSNGTQIVQGEAGTTTTVLHGNPDGAPSFGQVVTGDIADLNVTTAKLANDAVTNAKLADDAVQTENILNGTIANDDLDKANIPISGFGNATTDVAIGDGTTNYRITNVLDPTDNQDAATKAYVDSYQFSPGSLNLTEGRILVGDGNNIAAGVNMSGDATINTSGVLTIADNAINSAKINDGSIANNDLNKANIPISGFGNATTNVAIGDGTTNYRITGVALPVDPTDVATRQFVEGMSFHPGSLYLQEGHIFVGNNTGYANDTEMTGDVRISVLGVTTIQPGVVNTDELADGAVTSAKIADGTIVANDLDDGSVTAAKIADANVTHEKLAINAVGEDNIINGVVSENKIADDAVTSAKIADNAVITRNILDGAVTSAKIANDAVTSAKIDDETIVSNDLADNAVTSVKIANGTIQNEDLDKGDIPLSGFGNPTASINMGGQIITNLGAPQNATDAATRGYVDSQTSGQRTLTDGQIFIGNAADIATGQTVEGDISITNTGTVTLTSNAVETDNITNAAVTNPKIASDAVAETNIQNGAVTTSKIANGTILIEDINPTSISTATSQNTIVQRNAAQNIEANSAHLTGLATNSFVYTDANSILTTTAPISGTIGYWVRNQVDGEYNLSPFTTGDNIITSGDISTLNNGTVTSNGLLTANNGFTVSDGDIRFTEYGRDNFGILYTDNSGLVHAHNIVPRNNYILSTSDGGSPAYVERIQVSNLPRAAAGTTYQILSTGNGIVPGYVNKIQESNLPEGTMVLLHADEATYDYSYYYNNITYNLPSNNNYSRIIIEADIYITYNNYNRQCEFTIRTGTTNRKATTLRSNNNYDVWGTLKTSIENLEEGTTISIRIGNNAGHVQGFRVYGVI